MQGDGARQVAQAVVAEPEQGVRLRGVGVGAALTLWVNFWITYAEYVVHASRMNLSHFPVALFASFVVLVVSAVAIHRLSGALGLSRGDLSVALAMGMVGAMVPTSGLMGFFLGVIATPFYFATPENGWATYFHPYIPQWLAPHDVGHTLTWFFDGPPQAVAIPWSVWLVPIGWWLLFIGAVVAVSMGVAVILRKPWSEHERLVYPLVALAEELMDVRSGNLPALFRLRAFRVGAAIPLFIAVWNIGTFFWTIMPRINMSGRWYALARDFPTFCTRINFFTLGFSYLANLEVLFSLWFFFLLVGAEVFVFHRLGYSIGGAGDDWSSDDAAAGWQSFGALLCMVLWGLYVARHHIRDVIRHAWRPTPELDDRAEMMSYRSAVLAVAIGVPFLFLWLNAAGMAFRLGFFFIFGTFVVYLGVARIVAESGLIYVRAPLTPQNFAIFTVGSRELPDASMTVSAFTYTLLSQGKGLFMSPLVHAAKLGEGIRGDRRKLGWAIVLALVLGVALCVWLTFHLGYTNGAYNFDDYPFSSGSKLAFRYALDRMRNPIDTDWRRLGFLAVGAGAMGALIVLRYRFPGWPIHPIGFTIPLTYASQNSVFAMFLAWGIKSLVMRLGGVTLYARTRPFFVGLATGYAMGVALTFAIDWIWFFGHGHGVHSW